MEDHFESIFNEVLGDKASTLISKTFYDSVWTPEDHCGFLFIIQDDVDNDETATFAMRIIALAEKEQFLSEYSYVCQKGQFPCYCPKGEEEYYSKYFLDFEEVEEEETEDEEDLFEEEYEEFDEDED